MRYSKNSYNTASHKYLGRLAGGLLVTLYLLSRPTIPLHMFPQISSYFNRTVPTNNLFLSNKRNSVDTPRFTYIIHCNGAEAAKMIN